MDILRQCFEIPKEFCDIKSMGNIVDMFILCKICKLQFISLKAHISYFCLKCEKASFRDRKIVMRMK